MKNTFLKTTVGTFLALLMLFGAAQIFISAQESETGDLSEEQNERRGQNIEGVWQVAVTSRNCQTGAQVAPTFRGLFTFHQGGTMSESSVASGQTPASRSCQTGNPIRTFQGLVTFNEGGTMAETSTALSPALRTPGHGVWRSEPGFQQYSIAITFLRFNPDGTFFGTQVLRQTVTLAPGGNQLNSTNFVEAYNASGNLLGTGCATSVGTRFE